MDYDKEKYKIWDWKHPVILHWILNPGLVINDLVLGQTVPKTFLMERYSDKPFYARSIVPCPHCGTHHPGIKYSKQNNTVFKNWFGYYCDNCTKIIPVQRNLTSLLILGLTYPLWIWFKKPLKDKWLKKQPQRFENLNLELDHSKNTTKNWLIVGLIWGVLMYVVMTLRFPIVMDESITKKSILIGIPVWLIGGILFGLMMKYWMNKKGKSVK